jgi:hypothetical protein
MFYRLLGHNFALGAGRPYVALGAAVLLLLAVALTWALRGR